MTVLETRPFTVPVGCPDPKCSYIRKGRILHAVRKIHSTLDQDAILRNFLELSVDELGTEGGTIYFVDHAEGILASRHIVSPAPVARIVLNLGEGIAGTVAQTGRPILADDAGQAEAFVPAVDASSGYRTRNAIGFPLKDERGTVIGVLQLVNKREGAFTREDTAFLEEISVFTALAIKNAQHWQDRVERVRMQREINLAREIQARIAPRSVSVPGFEAWAGMEPCSETAGDYYHVFPFGERVLVVVADVSGKGLAAAMVASAIHSYLCATVGKRAGVAALAAEVSEFLWTTYECDKYATAVFLAIGSDGAVDYVNAGHTPLLRIAAGTMEALMPTGIPLGMLPGSSFESRSLTLSPGDCLVAQSDGYTEALNADEEEFGLERLGASLAACAGRTLEAVARHVEADLRSFQDGTPPTDDRTLFLLRRR